MRTNTKINYENSNKKNFNRRYNSDLVMLYNYKTRSYIRRNQKARLKLHIIKTRLKYTYKDLERVVKVKERTLMSLLNGRDINEDNLVKIEKFLNNL